MIDLSLVDILAEADATGGLIALLVHVETNDKSGTGETVLVGVFDDEDETAVAQESASRFYASYRTSFRQIPVTINQACKLAKVR